MAHWMYVKGLKFEVLSVHVNKPNTMAHIKLISNGVTYEAHGWTRWDGKDEWIPGRGYNIAIKRARRKIVGRLRWEAGLAEDVVEAAEIIRDAEFHLQASQKLYDDNDALHRDGGTVRL